MEAANRLAASLAAKSFQNRTPPNFGNRPPPNSFANRLPPNPGPGRPPLYSAPYRPPQNGPGRPPMYPGPGRPPQNNNNPSSFNPNKTINNSPSMNKPKPAGSASGKPPGMEIILDDEEDGEESPTCKMCMKDFWYKSQLHDHLKAEHSIADPVQHEKEQRMEKIKAEQEERQKKLAIIRAEQERKFRLAQREQEMRMKRAREEQQKKLRLIQAERARLEIEKKMRGEQISPRGPMRPGLSITQLQLENQRPGSFARDSGDIEKLKRESFMERRIREQSILNTQSSSKDLINEIIGNSKKRDKMKRDQQQGRLLVQQVLENRAKGGRGPVKNEKSPNSLLKANADLLGALAGGKGRPGVEATEEILLSKNKGIVISRIDGEAHGMDKNRPSFQHKNGLFICDICQKTCRNSTEMMQHWKVHFMKGSPSGQKTKVKEEGDGNNNEAVSRPMKFSKELSEIVGLKHGTRQQCVKEVWAYIKRHKLLDSENGQYIIPDEKMAKVFGQDRMRAFVMSKELSKHLQEIDDSELSDSSAKKGNAKKKLDLSKGAQKVKKEPKSDNEAPKIKIKKEKESPASKKKSPGRPTAKVKVKSEPKSDDDRVKQKKSTETPKAKKTNTPKVKKEPGTKSDKEQTTDDQDEWTPTKEMNKNKKKVPTPKGRAIIKQKNGRKYKENIFNDNASSDNNENNDNQTSEEQQDKSNSDSNKQNEVDDKSKIKKLIQEKKKKSSVFDPFASSSDDKPNDKESKESLAKKRKLEKDKVPDKKIKIKKEPGVQSDHNEPPPPKKDPPKKENKAAPPRTTRSKHKLPKVKTEPKSDHDDASVKDKIDDLFNNPPEPMDEDNNEDNNEPEDPDKPVYNCENIASECKFKTYDQEKFRVHVDKVHLGGGDDTGPIEDSLSAADDLPLS